MYRSRPLYSDVLGMPPAMFGIRIREVPHLADFVGGCTARPDGRVARQLGFGFGGKTERPFRPRHRIAAGLVFLSLIHI